MKHKTFALTGAVLGATLSTAHADPETETEAPPAATAAPSSDVDRLTLPKSRVLLDAFFELSLSSDAVGKPFSITPDLWYGATDELTVGLVHSSRAATGFIGGVGDALCLAGESNGCADVYSGVGVDARYQLKTGPLALAANGGLYIGSFDPFQLALKLGAVGRWSSGKLAIEFAPNLFIGLTERTPDAVGGVAADTNEEVLNVPVTGLYSVAPKISVALQLGVQLPFQNTGDTYAIPLSIGGHYLLNESLNLSLAFSLPQLAGGGDQTGFDARTLTLGGTYAF